MLNDVASRSLAKSKELISESLVGFGSTRCQKLHHAGVREGLSRSGQGVLVSSSHPPGGHSKEKHPSWAGW